MPTLFRVLAPASLVIVLVGFLPELTRAETSPVAAATPAPSPAVTSPPSPAPSPATFTAPPASPAPKLASADHPELIAADRYRDALVSLELVLTVTAAMDGRSQRTRDVRFRVDGTLIDATGLVVFSHRTTDPLTGSPERQGVTYDSKLKSCKIVLPSGTELAARIVLSDPLLDLAFARPEKPAAKLPFVPLTGGKVPGLLDRIVVIGRLDSGAGRAMVVSPGSIVSVINRPRRYYLIDTAAGLGCPAFDLAGNCFGLVLSRTWAGSQEMMSLHSFTNVTGNFPAVLPATEILKVAQQIPPRK